MTKAMRDTPTEAITDAMLEAGANAYHDAVVRAQTARQQRNDVHEAAGRGRPAHEDSIFPVDWLEPVYTAMQAARSEIPVQPPETKEDICAACGETIDFRPGESFMASTDAKVWHMGCAPSRR